MERFKMLVLLALRSMVSHRIKNAIVGSIMVVGITLTVVGTAVLDSVQGAMRESVTASATGHIQVFSEDAEDQLAIFGQMGATMDIGEIEDFPTLRAALMNLPGVKDVVPMALGNAVSFGTSELDRVLVELRQAVGDGSPEATERVRQVRQISELMLKQNSKAREVYTDLARLSEEREIIEEVLSDAFWRRFRDEPGPGLEFLDTRFAPISTEGKLIYLRYIATDPTQFARSFPRFQIVDGQAIPEGTRGILFAKRFYEQQVKNRVAREFDAIMEEVREGVRIDSDEVLANRVKRMSRLAASVVFQINPGETEGLLNQLIAFSPTVAPQIDEQMVAFLQVSDSNAAQRYAFFYQHIAPLIDVYDLAIGDDIVLQAFTKAGYAKAVKVKVWGTFNFRGLEGSDLAGVINLMDLVTFRQLYGKMTQEQREELNEIREQAGVQDVAAEQVEELLFGEAKALESEVVGDERSSEPDVRIERDLAQMDQQRTFSSEELTNGVILNAALILNDPSRVDETISAINELSRRQNLHVQAIDWQRASGLVGQFILVISLVLYTAIVVIFTVSLVIINNSMVMATMERIPEIGTIRAIGAQKSTIIVLTLLETTSLCLIAGVVGALVGAGVVAVLGVVGIPASNDVMVFLFGGPRLFPSLGISNLVFGVAIVLAISALSTIYPALVAIGVQPAVAMRAKD